ncbi:hypothetical protein GZL_00228 [Streptomyces sp. 769]|nr:hypothetical protein GZL_00228 [Streptomyces sp. 769]
MRRWGEAAQFDGEQRADESVQRDPVGPGLEAAVDVVEREPDSVLAARPDALAFGGQGEPLEGVILGIGRS